MAVVEIVAAGAASAQALSAIISQLNGARSVVIEIDNNTNTILRRVRDHHDHGGFAVTPSSNIPPQHADIFGAQSNSFSLGTGTEGNVVYTFDGLAELTISWVNPFVGGNESRGAVSGGQLALFRIVTTTGVGNTAAHMRYELFERAQANWRFCHKCNMMFFDGFPQKGVCPAGGGHEAAGFNFVLPHDTPESGQKDWRFCHRCEAMFFDGSPQKGFCSAGGGHEAAGFNFVLPHDNMPETPTAQAAWRFCEKCHAMFFDGFPDKGRCPVGGLIPSAGRRHKAQGFNFVLPHHN
jgi:hypothetical protein